MKKTTKKLVLNRETLISLESRLQGVAGAISKMCTLSGLDTCGTCQASCTSNLC
jgi:hypothetical protein